MLTKSFLISTLLNPSSHSLSMRWEWGKRSQRKINMENEGLNICKDLNFGKCWSIPHLLGQSQYFLELRIEIQSAPGFWRCSAADDKLCHTHCVFISAHTYISFRTFFFFTHNDPVVCLSCVSPPLCACCYFALLKKNVAVNAWVCPFETKKRLFL